jgi:hypothetical protein
MPANNARQPTTATTGVMVAVFGSDARAVCAGCPVVGTGLVSIRAGIVALAIEMLDDATSPCWLVPPGVEAAGVASALTLVS